MTFTELLDDQLGAHVDLDAEIDDTAIDSLEYLELVKRIEEEFHVFLPDEALSQVKTFRDLQAIAQC